MGFMTPSLDSLMESATAALMRTDHAACEALCLQALAQARQARDWDTYLRILRPLQEARRWRRQLVADEAERHLAPGKAAEFLAAGEALGDAMLAACTAPPGSPERVAELEDQLNILCEHEKLHQALAATVKTLAKGPA